MKIQRKWLGFSYNKEDLNYFIGWFCWWTFCGFLNALSSVHTEYKWKELKTYSSPWNVSMNENLTLPDALHDFVGKFCPNFIESIHATFPHVTNLFYISLLLIWI